MTTPTSKDAAGQYATAHATHYTAKDLHAAIESYHRVIMQHPASPEAGYSRTQIMNIASRVLAKDLLLEAQIRLALAELGEKRDSGIPDVAPSEDVSC